MSVKFDAITPVLTPEQFRQQQQRMADRQARQQRFGDERRQQLLDVAWALWQEAGGQGFNMRQLAQRAGYTAGALYAYFPGREAILSALQQRVVQELADLVSGIKAPRGERTARLRRDGGLVSSAQAVQARTLFIERSVAWWAWLAGDTQRLELVLHGGHGLQDAAGEACGSASVLLARLAEALQPCLETLQACGLAPDAAQQLHDEVLAYGLGLLVLQGPKRGEGRALMESRFVQSLQRWMDLALAATQQEADEAGQGDLFSV